MDRQACTREDQHLLPSLLTDCKTTDSIYKSSGQRRLLHNLATKFPAELVDRTLANVVALRCPVLPSLDPLTVEVVLVCLLGRYEEAKLLRPFLLAVLQEIGHFRLHLRRLEGIISHPTSWYIPSGEVPQLRNVRHLQLQCDRVVANKREMSPIAIREVQFLHGDLANLRTLTLHVTLYLRGSVAADFFYEELAKLLDIIKDNCPGREKFIRGRVELAYRDIWYLPLVKVDTRPSKVILAETSADMPEQYR